MIVNFINLYIHRMIDIHTSERGKLSFRQKGDVNLPPVFSLIYFVFFWSTVSYTLPVNQPPSPAALTPYRQEQTKRLECSLDFSATLWQFLQGSFFFFFLTQNIYIYNCGGLVAKSCLTFCHLQLLCSPLPPRVCSNSYTLNQ